MGFCTAKEMTGQDGRPVLVLSQGEPTECAERMVNARVVIDGVVHCGGVVIGSATPWEESVVLRVTECECSQMFDMDGRVVPQVVVPIADSVRGCYERLVDSSVEDCPCGEVVARMDDLRRTDLFTRLIVERLQRKCGVVESLFVQSDSDWNQTMYAMLFRAMGDHRNQAAFQQLAQTVPYHVLVRERASVECVEALLLGGSGLLRRYAGDEHTRKMQSDFEYLARKYSIRPMMGGEWTLSGINPNNSPVMRIVQLAGYVSRTDFIFDKLLKCQTAEDINHLLGGEGGRASGYWDEHFAPGKSSPKRSKRLGDSKINLLGINFVVPLMFAYGRYTESEELKERALDLLESLKLESNYITRHWSGRGVSLRSAFDSQAVIQLEREYCELRGCWKCHIGRGEIKKSLETL